MPHRLERASPQDVLAWALRAYEKRIVLACSFGGPTGIAALDMAVTIDPEVKVYFIDTGLLFPETHALIDEVRRRYRIDPTGIAPRQSVDEQAAAYGDGLWQRNPDLCCTLRKIEPQRAFLRGYDAWISGIRRDQAESRARVPAVSWDERFGLMKINPFAHWSEAMVWEYVRRHDLPYNRLHDRNFPSIGCSPCTRAVRPGDSLRAGRWPGAAKIECGLHR